MRCHESHHDAENLVVCLVRSQIFRQWGRFHFGLEIKVSLCFLVAKLVQGNTFFHQFRFVDVGNELVQCPGDLTDVSCHVGHAAFVVVQFFQRDHRQVDVVFLETEEAGRVMHQDVGIQYEQFGFAGFAGCTGQRRLFRCFNQFFAGWASWQFCL